MPLPAASFINQLDPTQPTGTQKKYEGDDWFRLIQFVLQTQFPNLGAQAVLPTALQLNSITLAIRVQSPETPPLFPLIAARANRLMAFDASGNFDTSRTLAQFDADVANTNTKANQAATSATNAATSETNAGTSATNAAASAVLSQQWATNLTAVPGGGGLLGARAYAQQASTSATNAATSETNAGTSATNAANSATQAGNTLNGTSTTSLLVGTGSKSLTTQTNKAWLPGARLNLSSQGTPSATMRGNVTSYTPASGALVILIDGSTGSGTFNDWNINVTGSDASGLPTASLADAGKAPVINAAGNGYVVQTGTFSNRNRLLNGSFNVNQRLVSGTVTLAAGAYGHDRWKAGTGGCTYTFASSGGVTTLTITAGTLVQVVEGINLQTGTHVLTWSGTATGRIAAAAFTASGQTGSVTGGSNLSVEFGTGTLASAQLELGSVGTPFEFRNFQYELAMCRRYTERLRGLIARADTAQSSGSAYVLAIMREEKMAIPTITFSNITYQSSNTAAPNAASTSAFEISFTVVATNAYAIVDALCVSEL